jgi:hypothetical protein
LYGQFDRKSSRPGAQPPDPAQIEESDMNRHRTTPPASAALPLPGAGRAEGTFCPRAATCPRRAQCPVALAAAAGMERDTVPGPARALFH